LQNRLFRIGCCLALLLWLPTASAMEAPVSGAEWQPRIGDRVVVDTTVSMVYLVHADGGFRAMNGLTGQRRVVSYDGITYNARTPEREWEMRSFEKKGKSVTFGDGRFGRLSWPGHEDPRRGNESTAYGIHSHRSFAKMLEDKQEKNAWDPTGMGHRSMGCILVSEDDLTLIQQTWELNGGILLVSTRDGVDTAEFGTAVTDDSVTPSWLG
jgi:hypothetical protein